jgi:hypothetical protein
MLIEILITISFALYIYFKVIRQDERFTKSDNYGRKKKKNDYVIIAKTIYRFIFHTKEEGN